MRFSVSTFLRALPVGSVVDDYKVDHDTDTVFSGSPLFAEANGLVLGGSTKDAPNQICVFHLGLMVGSSLRVFSLFVIISCPEAPLLYARTLRCSRLWGERVCIITV
jgi:hypothetical protein